MILKEKIRVFEGNVKYFLQNHLVLNIQYNLIQNLRDLIPEEVWATALTSGWYSFRGW